MVDSYVNVLDLAIAYSDAESKVNLPPPLKKPVFETVSSAQPPGYFLISKTLIHVTCFVCAKTNYFLSIQRRMIHSCPNPVMILDPFAKQPPVHQSGVPVARVVEVAIRVMMIQRGAARQWLGRNYHWPSSTGID